MQKMASWLMSLCASKQRSAAASMVSAIGRLGLALVLAVLLSTLFSDMAQAHSETPTGSVEEVLAKGLRLAEASPVHLAVRDTGVSNSTRCAGAASPEP